jgi:hypothetical protein
MNRRDFSFALLGTAGAIAFRPFPSQPQLRVNRARLLEHINALVEFVSLNRSGKIYVE